MKKKILVLAICVLALLVFVLTSCTVEEASKISIFNMYNAIQDMLEPEEKGLDSKIEYVNSEKYAKASENYLLIKESDTVDEAWVEKLTVKNIKTNDEIYSITYESYTEEPGKIYYAEIILGNDDYTLNNIGKDYFVVTTKENGADDKQEDIITVEIHNIKNERICSYKGSISKFEKANYIPKIENLHAGQLDQETPCVFQINDHIFFMNKLYRQEENGLVLVKELEGERLLNLDYTCFEYMNERYVYISDNGEFYVFDKDFNYVRHEKVDVPYGYEYGFIGFLSLDKLVYVLDKRTDREELTDGEEYDFIFDGVAYTRDFYTYNLSSGNTSKIDDILYLDTVAVLCKSYINLKLTDVEVDFGADVLLVTDFEKIDDKYYERESLMYTTNDTLYDLAKVDTEILGFNTPDVNILGKLSTGNYVVSLPFENAIFNENKEEIAEIAGEIIKITDKYIVTDKGIYSHVLEEKYLFAENEQYYSTVGSTPIIVASNTENGYANNENTYYSFGDNGKVEITKTSPTIKNRLKCFDTFYRVEKSVDGKYLTTFYFENGEVIAEIETATSITDFSIFFTQLEDALIIAYEKDSEYQYVYAYVK